MACKLHLNIKAAKKLSPARGLGALTLPPKPNSALLPLLFLLTPPPDTARLPREPFTVSIAGALTIFLLVFPQDSDSPRAELCPRALPLPGP